jgi:2-polyprenyl-3-methyl-5-hydroxy-6-metoxy-1,4-benzoquinol methylase
LVEIYEEQYYSTEKPEYIKRYEKDQAWWDLCYDERYDYFEKQLPSNRRKILDVGSGPALFLVRGKSRGWDVMGIEPSRQAAAYSKGLGLNIKHGFLTAHTKDLGTFDVVHMGEVLEHVPNPLEMLTIARDLLNPSGYICIVVPNDYNPFQHALRAVDGYKPWWVAVPHHINYFEPSSLQHVLKQAGFEVTHTTTTFPIDLFLLMGDNYIGNDILGKACHAKRKRFEMTLQKAGLSVLRQKLYQQFATLNIGREIVMYGKKI